jgi:hypothetical protein
LATRSHARYFSLASLIAAPFFFGGCTAAFGPGYTIEKQEIRVHFLPSPESRILIEADYTLRNTGNQPLSALEIRLPGRRRFHFVNSQVAWDSSNLSFQPSPSNDRNELLTFPQPWPISAVHKLRLSVEYRTGETSPSTLGFTADAFFLPAQGWGPELLPSRGQFGTGGVPPKKWNLLTTLPSDFQFHASGKSPKKSHHGNENTFSAEQTPSDFYPFIVAGKYQVTRFGEGKQKVFLWTRSKVAPDNLQTARDALLRTTKAYDEVFGARPHGEQTLWIVECPQVTGCFTVPSTTSLQNLEAAQQEPVKAEMASLDTLMIDLSGGTQILAAVAAPSLASSWLGYGKNPGFFEQDLPLSALPTFAAAIGRDAAIGPDARAATIRNALHAVPQTPDKKFNEDLATLRVKSFLFFYALQDRYGPKIFRNATSHMFYARQGRGFNLNDLIAAFDQESHQNLAEFVRLWMKHPGVPRDFRARYDRNAATAQISKEATP